MAKGVNKVILIGNLGKDPEVRFMPSGDATAKFSIATAEEWKDKATGEKKTATEWHNLVFFKRLAEVCGEYLRKGSKIYVEGALKTRKWTDKNGIDRYTTEIHVREMQMLDGNKGDHGKQYAPEDEDQTASYMPPASSGKNQLHNPDLDDDIPF